MRLSTSREEIRKDIILQARDYLDLQNIDLSKSHYLSYILDVLSGLTANLLNFTSLSYQETVLPTAQLDDSIRNLAMMIGYNPCKAKNATVDVLMGIHLDKLRDSNGNLIDFRIYIDSYQQTLQKEMSLNPGLTLDEISNITGFKLKSNDNIFQLINDSYIIESHNNQLRVYKENNTGMTLIPRQIDNGKDILYFTAKFDQIELSQYQYTIGEINKYQFYTITQTLPDNKMIKDIQLYVNGELWNQSDNHYTMSSLDKKYVLKIYKDKFVVIFGNGVLGKQPSTGDNIIIVAQLTNGEKGNVLAKTITNLDRIFVTSLTSTRTSSVILQEVKYFATNINSAKGGIDIESNEVIKNKAIANLTSLKRLVSSQDFKNLLYITDLNYRDVISYLKRSDLKVNEINVYGVLELNEKIIPTSNGKFDVTTLPSGTLQINPYIDVLNFDNYKWYCPYLINIDMTTRVGNYYYLLANQKFEYIVRYSNNINYPIFLTDITLNSNFNAQTFDFTLLFNSEDTYNLNNVSVKVDITGKDFFYTTNYQPLNITPGSNNGIAESTLSFSINQMTYPSDTTKMIIYVQDNGVDVAKYESNITLKYNLSNYTMSQIITDPNNGNNYILDVPLIEKDWYDNLSPDEKVEFENILISNMIDFYDSTENRMLNTFINFKFAKTKGLIHNIYFNNEEIRVVDKVANRAAMNPADVVVGNRFIIDGPITGSDPPEFQDMEGAIALYKGIDTSTGNEIWDVNLPATSTLAFVNNLNSKYFYDGRKWTNKLFSLPIQIHVILYTKTGYLTYVEQAKKALLDYYKEKFKLDTSIYRSEIYDILMELDGVVYVKVLKPTIDYVYKYKIDDLSFNQLIDYTPEFIWFDDIDIKVDVQIS